MDFLDPKKKRAHRIRLFIGYGLMAIALGFATTVLVFEAYGFDINRKTGEVIQNGLVFVDSHPVASDVYLNGEYKARTDTRLVIPTGQYELELRSEGYRSWSKKFRLEGSSIERFVYPFLFPTELQTEDSQLYASTPKFASQSPDRRWVVVQRPGTLTEFDVIDLSTEVAQTTVLNLPAALFTEEGANHTFTEVEWSTDNRHVLVRHTFEGGTEFGVIDREAPTESYNVNKTFNIPITRVSLLDKKFDRLYLYDANGGIVRSANAQTGEMSVLLTNVLAFKTHGSDVILYATRQGADKDKVNVHVLSNDKDYKLRELPIDEHYLLELATFDGQWYMAVGSSAEKKAYVYKDPFVYFNRADPGRRIPVPVSVLKLNTVADHVSFSANTRFIGLQGGSEFAVYDAETDRTARYDTKLALAAKQKATWMDGHRFTLVSNDKVVVFDYDGTNMQTLVSASPAFQPFFDRDYENLYVIGPSTVVPNRAALTRTELRITN